MNPIRGRAVLSRRKPVAVAGVVVVALTAAAWGSASSGAASIQGRSAGHKAASDKGVTLNVGWQTADIPALWKASGLFNKTPYTLKFSVLAGPAAQIAALDGNQIDVGEAGDNSGAFQVANSPTSVTAANIPIQGIAVSWTPKAPAAYQAPLVYALKSSGIKTLAGLKGHTIGFNEGGNIQAGYAAALAKVGYTPKDVKPVVFQANQEAADAFDAGKVDAVVTQAADVYQLTSEGKAIQLANSEQLGLIGGGGWLATSSALKNPAKLAAIKDFFTRVKTFYTTWYPAHESEVLHVEETVADETPPVAKITFLTNEHTEFYLGGAKKFLKIEQTGVDNAYKDGFLKSNVNIDIGYNPLLDSLLSGSGS
jgi:sulfonate transport system substrate-binding protein